MSNKVDIKELTKIGRSKVLNIYSLALKWRQGLNRELFSILGVIFFIYLLIFAALFDFNRSISENSFIYNPDILASTGDDILDVATKPSHEKEKLWSSFGDGYSSFAYLDEDKTDMFLDSNVSALVFPPLYNFEFKEDCLLCYNSDNLVEIDKTSPYKSIGAMPKPTPSELIGKDITSASIYRLDKKTIATFVFKDDGEERAFIYFLENNKYSSIINNESEEIIRTKYGREGGNVVIGGADDDFIILYSGYEGIAYHYIKGVLYDISKFFKINNMSGGFPAHIFRQEVGSEINWYILSLDGGINKLIKLWQNETEHIKGSIDLSFALSKSLANEKIAAYSLLKDRGMEFMLINKEKKSLVFSDKGFDNSKERQVVSKNINYKNYPVYGAVIKELEISLDSNDSEFENKFSDKLINIYLGDSLDNLKKAMPNKELKFKGNNEAMFIKMIFYPKTGNSNYSPWADSMNDMKYLIER